MFYYMPWLILGGTGLVQTSSEEISPWSSSPLIVSRDPSALEPEFAHRLGVAQPTLANVDVCFLYVLNKETSFLELDMNVICNVHTSVYDKRDDFVIPIINFPWLSGDVPRLPSYCVYNLTHSHPIFQLALLGVVLAFWIYPF